MSHAFSSLSSNFFIDRGHALRQNPGHWLINPLLGVFLGTVGIIESVWILRSNGFYPIDECAHFLYSRFVLQVLPVTVQTWHRPGLLWLFALPAQLGHLGTMFFGLALFLVLLLITYRIAVIKGIRHPEWAVILTGLQPILFDISYACLAETPAALLLVLSYWLHLKGKHGWCLLIASAVFLFRFEMYGFAVIMAAVYLKERKWRILPLVLFGPLLWIASSAVISGDVMTFFREWSRFSGLGKYVAGISLTYYFENLHTIFGYTQMLFFAIGVILIVRARQALDYGFILSVPAIGIIVNTLAGAEVFHLSGSIGDLRYVAVIGPFVGIISAYGLSRIFEKLHLRPARLALSGVVAGAVILNCIVTTHPRHWSNEDAMAITLTRTLRAQYPDTPLLSNNYLAAYALDVPPWGGREFAKLDSDMLKMFPECVILWDPFSSNPRFHKSELTEEKLLQDPTVSVIRRYPYRDTAYILLYRNTASTRTDTK